jgi:tetratricopeptide (TPR) repeat protein
MSLLKFRRWPRRVRLIVVTPFVALLWLAALFLARPEFVTSVAARAYAAGNYDAAALTFEWGRPANVLEPWKNTFNRATAWAAGGHYDDAIAGFEEAWGQTWNPSARCYIANNEVWAQEHAGDEAADDATRRDYYTAALATIVRAGDCWDELTPTERIQDKLDAVGEATPGGEGEGETGPAPTAQQAADLEQRETAAEQARQGAAGVTPNSTDWGRFGENRW